MTGFARERYVSAITHGDGDEKPSVPSFPAYHVRDVMTRDVAWVTDETPLKQIAYLLAANRVHGVPVVDDQQRVVGVVTASDLLARVAGADHSMPRGHRVTAHHANLLKRRALTAAELMTAPPITVTPATSISAAARLAARSRVRSLPVVDGDGTLLGIVTRDDMVKVFLRSDEDIAHDVRRDVIEHVPTMPGHSVEVAVSAGVVTLSCRVGSSLGARSLEHNVRAVAGVVEVQNDLTYDVDDAYLPATW
jgi:CBS domain-containing protein